MNALIDAIARGVRVVDLGHPLDEDAPHSLANPGFRLSTLTEHGQDLRDGGLSVASDAIAMATHTGTHVDALRHVSRQGKLHGDIDHGSDDLGAETIEPRFCRGILLDVAAHRGVQRLSPAAEIDSEALQAAAGTTGIRPGDAVLIRTGWAQHWPEQDAFFGKETGVPGITTGAAQWLAEAGATLVGSDTPAVELITPAAGYRNLPVHALLLAERGINLIEALNLEELAGTGITEFALAFAPLNIRGATGSPVRPLAITEDLPARPALS